MYPWNWLYCGKKTAPYYFCNNFVYYFCNNFVKPFYVNKDVAMISDCGSWLFKLWVVIQNYHVFQILPTPLITSLDKNSFRCVTSQPCNKWNRLTQKQMLVHLLHSSLDWVLSHWAHFTVHRFICHYLCVFCVFLFNTACVLYYYEHGVVDLMGLKPNPYRTLSSFSALTLLIGSFDP